MRWNNVANSFHPHESSSGGGGGGVILSILCSTVIHWHNSGKYLGQVESFFSFFWAVLCSFSSCYGYYVVWQGHLNVYTCSLRTISNVSVLTGNTSQVTTNYDTLGAKHFQLCNTFCLLCTQALRVNPCTAVVTPRGSARRHWTHTSALWRLLVIAHVPLIDSKLAVTLFKPSQALLLVNNLSVSLLPGSSY